MQCPCHTDVYKKINSFPCSKHVDIVGYTYIVYIYRCSGKRTCEGVYSFIYLIIKQYSHAPCTFVSFEFMRDQLPVYGELM